MNPNNRTTKTTQAIRHAIPDLGPTARDEILKKTRIHIHVGLPALGSPGVEERRTQAKIILNLLPRMFETVTISGDEVETVFPPSHRERIGREQILACDLLVVVGDETPRLETERTLYVDSRGWTAYLSTKRSWTAPHGPTNRLGAFYAGALAVQDSFNWIFREHLGPKVQVVHDDITHDLVTLENQRDPNHEPVVADVPLRLPETALVGLGGVGQATVLALCGLDELFGSIWLLDHEPTDAGNEQRYVLSYQENRGRAKVDLASNELSERFPRLRLLRTLSVPLRFDLQVQQNIGAGDVNIEGDPIVVSKHVNVAMSYEMFRRATGGSLALPLVVSAVDSSATRRDIQAGLHATILNGWTRTEDGMVDYGFGVHRAGGQNACLACMYHPGVADPTPAVFAARITGKSTEWANRRLLDSAILLTAEDIEEIAAHQGRDAAELKKFMGKSLNAFMHFVCGQVSVGGDRDTSTPINFLPVLVGVHLATQLILTAMGHASAMDSVAEFEASRMPTQHGVRVQRKNFDCFCQLDEVRQVYESAWGRTDEMIDSGVIS